MKTTPSVAAAFHKAPNEDPGSAQAVRRQPGFPQGSGTRGAERGALWTRAPPATSSGCRFGTSQEAEARLSVFLFWGFLFCFVFNSEELT